MVHLPQKKPEGFTLAELMIVVALLSIVLIFVFPAVRPANNNFAAAASCSSALRAIQSAKAGFVAANPGVALVDTNNPTVLGEYAAFFESETIPESCPATPLGETPYAGVYDLYSAATCAHNCLRDANIADYPLEPPVGAPEYYKNGYHDLGRTQR